MFQSDLFSGLKRSNTHAAGHTISYIPEGEREVVPKTTSRAVVFVQTSLKQSSKPNYYRRVWFLDEEVYIVRVVLEHSLLRQKRVPR